MVNTAIQLTIDYENSKMALPRVPVSTFLSSAKASLEIATQKGSPVTFVIGNESADLDSICSAVTLAYLRTFSPSSSSSSRTTYIPLSNLPRADLSLRTELQPVLSRANLRASDLITLSDFSPKALKVENTRWVLVDHNSLRGELGTVFGKRVVGCVDHHDEEGKVRPVEECEREGEMRVLKKAGSCASLVVEWARKSWDEMTKGGGEGQRKMDRELAYLALAPVLIDTYALKSDKTTDTDRETASYLEGLIKEGYDREAFFDEVMKAKEDINDLSIRDILRKDYKQWSKPHIVVGISSVVKNMEWVVEKAGGKEQFLEEVKEWMKEKELNPFLLMSAYMEEGHLKRELFTFGTGTFGADFIKKFELVGGEALGLKTWKDGSMDSVGKEEAMACWEVTKVENSRKQVAPLVCRILGL
ncbi:exopolyphosphatase protein [Rutstroemia sp. NJR-2017a BVV2]|nr:exopolyphosphatase protein [Rutstroemia sp. NJR-2017a BVV2]